MRLAIQLCSLISLIGDSRIMTRIHIAAKEPRPMPRIMKSWGFGGAILLKLLKVFLKLNTNAKGRPVKEKKYSVNSWLPNSGPGRHDCNFIQCNGTSLISNYVPTKALNWTSLWENELTWRRAQGSCQPDPRPRSFGWNVTHHTAKILTRVEKSHSKNVQRTNKQKIGAVMNAI